MKKLILAISLLLLIACQKDQSTADKIKKDTEAAKTKYGEMIEDTKRTANELAEKAQEEAQLAAEALEDAAVDVKNKAEDVKQDVEDAWND